MLEVAVLKMFKTYLMLAITFGQGYFTRLGNCQNGKEIQKTSVLNGNNQVWDAKNALSLDGLVCSAVSTGKSFY